MNKECLKQPTFLERLLRLVYPMKCMFCDSVLPDSDNLRVCNSCHGLLPRVGKGFEAVHFIPYLNGLFAAYHYEQDLEKAIHTMKFKNQPLFSMDLAFLLYEEIKKWAMPDIDIIVPVPMHPKKQRQRGYNQSQLIAEKLGAFLNIPCDLMLNKTHATKAQSLLGRQERLKNLEGAFELKPTQSLEGACILLLDDVSTTGTTLNACAKMLYDAGAQWIFASVIAIAGN